MSPESNDRGELQKVREGAAIHFEGVLIDVEHPKKFDRIQVVLRVALVLAFSIVGGSVGWIYGFLYLAPPITAAVLLSRKPSEAFFEQDGPWVLRTLRWIVAFFAYLGFVTDRFPTRLEDPALRIEVAVGGHPRVESALLRILYGIPSALVLMVLVFIASLIWMVAVVWILIQERYPSSLYSYQRAVLRWGARLLAYGTSIVEPYPPFALDMGTTLKKEELRA